VSRSLQRELSRALAVAILAAGAIAALISFAFAFEQAQELQDDTLRQIAILAMSSPGTPSLGADAADTDSKILITSLAGAERPAWLPADLAPGFHTINGGPTPMRVYVHARGASRLAVAQPTDVRNESAITSALITLVPLLLLLPVLAWLARRLIRSRLSGVRRLARALDEQPTDQPQPLAGEDIPEEIAPFVEAINRLLSRINKLIGSQRRFIADAAHELRTPLTALAMQANNLEQAGAEADRRARTASLKAGIERARRLTEQLLDLARLQAGSAERSMVDVSRMARELIAEYLPVGEQRRIDIGMDEEAPLSLSCDAAGLRLILNNAPDNAVRHTPAGGHVTIRLARQGDLGVIEVVDTGPGIAKAELERVFEPFYRSPGSTGEGTGLGLAISRDAAERCGGSITLEPRPDQPGMIFRYTQNAR
jgi:two-component system OmpR family sensor kinase